METLKEWVQNWNFCLPGRGSEVGKFCSEYVQGPPDYVILNRLLLNRGRLDEFIFFLVSQFLLQVLSRSFVPLPPFLDFSSFSPHPRRGKFPSLPGSAQEWTNRTLISHERTSVHFLVLPGSLLSFTEITEYYRP